MNIRCPSCNIHVKKVLNDRGAEVIIDFKRTPVFVANGHKSYGMVCGHSPHYKTCLNRHRKGIRLKDKLCKKEGK